MYSGQQSQVIDYLQALKTAANRLTMELQLINAAENPVTVRLGELNAAIQRLQWEIEREQRTVNGDCHLAQVRRLGTGAK